MTITRDTVLRRAGELTIRVAGSEIAVLGPGGTARGGPLLLTALEVFAKPRTLADGIDALVANAHAAVDFMDGTAAVMQLVEAGALAAHGHGTTPPPKATGSGFDALEIHIGMLEDEQRTSSYLAAIRQVVRPGDVVVDLGTGTGVLAVAAAQAGAQRVYAIESTAIADCAEAVFAANGVADRVTLVRGVSSTIELPERADVLVTEIFGHDPFAERALEYIIDARRRLLKPGARIIPQRLAVYGELVTIDDETLARRRFTEAATERWRERYGVDFSPLARMPRAPNSAFSIRGDKTLAWPRLSQPTLLAEVDPSAISSSVIDRTVPSAIDRDGELGGLLVWFVLRLTADIGLSTRPDSGAGHSWRCMVWPCKAPPRCVTVGARACITLRAAAAGSEVSVIRHDGGPPVNRSPCL